MMAEECNRHCSIKRQYCCFQLIQIRVIDFLSKFILSAAAPAVVFVELYFVEFVFDEICLDWILSVYRILQRVDID